MDEVVRTLPKAKIVPENRPSQCSGAMLVSGRVWPDIKENKRMCKRTQGQNSNRTTSQEKTNPAPSCCIQDASSWCTTYPAINLRRVCGAPWNQSKKRGVKTVWSNEQPSRKTKSGSPEVQQVSSANIDNIRQYRTTDPPSIKICQNDVKMKWTPHKREQNHSPLVTHQWSQHARFYPTLLMNILCEVPSHGVCGFHMSPPWLRSIACKGSQEMWKGGKRLCVTCQGVFFFQNRASTKAHKGHLWKNLRKVASWYHHIFTTYTTVLFNIYLISIK